MILFSIEDADYHWDRWWDDESPAIDRFLCHNLPRMLDPETQHDQPSIMVLGWFEPDLGRRFTGLELHLTPGAREAGLWVAYFHGNRQPWRDCLCRDSVRETISDLYEPLSILFHWGGYVPARVEMFVTDCDAHSVLGGGGRLCQK